MKSFSVEILGRKSSVGRQYILKWPLEIKAVMKLYGMACVVALCFLVTKNFRVPENSALHSTLELFLKASVWLFISARFGILLLQYCSTTFALGLTRPMQLYVREPFSPGLKRSELITHLHIVPRV